MRPNTYVHRNGIAKFDRLEIECLEIHFSDNGKFSRHEYWIGKTLFDYDELLEHLKEAHPDISRLLFLVGETAFLEEVLSWDPSLDTTRNAFYNHLARQVKDWEDQPRS